MSLKLQDAYDNAIKPVFSKENILDLMTITHERGHTQIVDLQMDSWHDAYILNITCDEPGQLLVKSPLFKYDDHFRVVFLSGVQDALTS